MVIEDFNGTLRHFQGARTRRGCSFSSVVAEAKRLKALVWQGRQAGNITCGVNMSSGEAGDCPLCVYSLCVDGLHAFLFVLFVFRVYSLHNDTRAL